MELNEFKRNFVGFELPKELILLNEFDNNVSDYYSEGFELALDDKSGIATWSENKDFLDRLMPFAQANASGSIYALWDDGENKELVNLPVVVFGDEGGYHVVAENIIGLLQLLTFDTEISVDYDEVYFYKDEEDYEESHNLSLYKNWLKENLNLEPIENTEEIIEKAQQKYKSKFDNWVGQYYSEE
ncbi:hypothetical protein [Chryseobacterium sp. EO14]|uniref:hypothetical protein n=1 Tax=Chryseobacterium sp. EO14 TaxID=2950551 RepID=UPI00210EA4F0|nr:hypothetical protein [Chryseobacterium sp. EO14]MCQ4140620.1 hypothetical protein [Chryseobacterium sp. EO14]